MAILLTIVHAALAATANIDKSPTFDEPTHLTAGYSYWLRNDFRFDPENGNLPARWAALPLLVSQPHFPPTEVRIGNGFPWEKAVTDSFMDQATILTPSCCKAAS